jgi:hypothetical protein
LPLAVYKRLARLLGNVTAQEHPLGGTIPGEMKLTEAKARYYDGFPSICNFQKAQNALLIVYRAG